MLYRVVLGSLLIVCSLACSSEDDADPGLGGAPSDYQACVDRINAFRATVGLPPYERDAGSEACADGQARSDSESGDAHGAFGDCGEWAQNECPGWDSIEQTIDGCLQSMWDEGPGGGHYDNMAGDYSEVFCGFYTTPDGEVWALQNFR
jgi:hypothetical protein